MHMMIVIPPPPKASRNLTSSTYHNIIQCTGMHYCTSATCKTGALITDGGEFHVSVPSASHGFIRDLDTVFLGSGTHNHKEKLKFFFFFSPTEPHAFLIKHIHLSWNSYRNFAIGCGNQTVIVFHQHFPTTWAHESSGGFSLFFASIHTVKCTQVLLRYDTYIDSATLFSMTITKYLCSTYLENIPWCLI